MAKEKTKRDLGNSIEPAKPRLRVGESQMKKSSTKPGQHETGRKLFQIVGNQVKVIRFGSPDAHGKTR